MTSSPADVLHDPDCWVNETSLLTSFAIMTRPVDYPGHYTTDELNIMLDRLFATLERDDLKPRLRSRLESVVDYASDAEWGRWDELTDENKSRILMRVVTSA